MSISHKIMRISLIACLLAVCLYAQADEIANDVVSDYAQVKELLGQFYRRSARRLGSDYDPLSANAEAQTVTFNDGTEASVNRKMWSELFENDIVLTLPQAEDLLKEQRTRGKRQAQPTASSFWPNLTISYQFAWTDSTWQTLIRSSLRHVESETCMRFRENGDDRDRLSFIRGSGCWSNVGKLGGRQQVSIGYGCDALGIVAHETLHALGLWHEQSRTDRDQYVTIKQDYIMRGTQGNFEKRTTRNSDNMGQAYDLGSVMHYGPKAFSTDWSQITIKTRDSTYQQTIGQREGLSFKDAKMINLRYCTGVCPYQLNCRNEGYTDPNNCNTCRCPKGYGGQLCDTVEWTSCGGDIYAQSSMQSLNSGYVTSSSNCVWRIKAPYGQRIELTFDTVSFLCRDTCRSFVEVKYGASKASAGARLCCTAPSTPLISENDEVLLIFRGEPDIPNGYHGFSIKFRTYGSETVAPLSVIPTTTTVQTTTAHRTIVTGEWGVWGEWTECTQKCGGCGTRQRIRGCYGGNGRCIGEFMEKQHCNIQVCSSPTTTTPKRSNVCNGRIMLPCDLVQKLDFGSKAGDSTKQQSLPLERDFARKKRSIQKNAADQDLCEKRFTYYCPTGLLTIHIDWRKSQSPANPSETSNCCKGFREENGYCYAI